MTLKQTLFVKEYLEHRNATKAVLNAYDVKNTNSAAVIGCKLLRNVKVHGEISRILEAEGSTLSRVVALIDNIMKYGSTREQLKVIQVVLKLYGLL